MTNPGGDAPIENPVAVTCVDDIIVNAELLRRPSRLPRYEAECRVLAALAETMAESPAALLQKLAECAIELTGAESAGVSLLEPDGADGEFRWAATAGEFFPFLGGKMPRNFSPCGTVLDRNATVLMTDPARFYPYVANFKPRIEEVLLIPFYQSRKPIGTVWVIAHSRARKFDAEDVRLITSVSKFASVAVNALSGSIAHDSLLRKVATQARVFDTTLSAITDFAYIVDRDCRFVYANKALLDLWGLEQEQAIGRNFFELNYPDALAKKLQRQIQQVVDSKVSVRDETPYTSPKGKTGHYEYIFSPVLSADGTVEVVAGSTRDITERTRLSVDLRKERAILAAIFEQAPAFICTLAGPDHVYELANERYYEIIGRRDIIGKTVRQALPEVEGQGFFELLDNVYRTGETFSGDQLPALLDRKGDGTLEQRFMNLVYRALRDLDGNVSGIFVHGVDVTDLVRAKENERAAKNEAEAANRAKDRFLAVLSHELRTPLSPVVMTIPAIEVDPDLPLKFREDLAMVRRNVDLEVRLIDDLLDLSRVIIGKLRLQMQPVRLHELLHHVIHGDMTDTPDKQLRIFEELRAGDDALFADPARLQQVFWNLLRNAAKFTPEGGRIDIRTWNADDTGDLFVEFKDTGVGIPPAMLGRIFDAFEQGEIGTTRQFGGLGLGLAIAKAVVEMHGGAIAAASEGTNRGATFTVRLPVRSAKTSTVDLAPPVQDMPQTPTPSHILLVEDHPDTARTMARLLEISGFKVKTAGTVESALQVAGAGTFDIIVSDIGLPDATGYELMEQIRDLYGIPGIALSGYGMEDDVRKSRESGFVEHVVKPVNIAQLELVIRRIIAESI